MKIHVSVVFIVPPAIPFKSTLPPYTHNTVNIFCGSRDCYDILEITDPKAATTKDIKKAYRRLSVLYHPDKNKNANAEELFREIAKAVEVLEDEKTREDYDYYLSHPWVWNELDKPFYMYVCLIECDVGLL